MLTCDLCNKKLVKNNTKWVENKEHQICFDCIKLCKKIVDDKNTFSVTFLPLYKEKVQNA